VIRYESCFGTSFCRISWDASKFYAGQVVYGGRHQQKQGRFREVLGHRCVGTPVHTYITEYEARNESHSSEEANQER
jgi:hypothetical protein